MDKLRKYFADKTIGFYIATVAALAALVANIIFVATCSGDKTFSSLTFILIFAGIASHAVGCVFDTKFISVLMPIFFGVALGLHLFVGLPTLSDVWNGVHFVGGNPDIVINYGIVFAICTVVAAVSSFMAQRKVK